MEINFDLETPEGVITFQGSLNKEEIDFLLKFAITSLLIRGTLPVMQLAGPDDPDAPINPEKLN